MKRKLIPFLLTGFAFLAGCSALQELVPVQKPAVRVSDTRLTAISFKGADLNLRFEIDNPNALAVSADGFDYELRLNGRSFLQGESSKTVSIPASGTGYADLPVSIQFQDIYRTAVSLKDRDSTRYQISAGFNFNLPVLGPVRIPVQSQGEIPLLKLPKIFIRSFKVKRMGLTGAELELVLNIENPNAIPLSMKTLQYDFSISQSRWASGRIDQTVEVARKGTGEIAIPINLDFLKMGQSMIRLVKGDAELDYQLRGALDLGSDLDLFREVRLPMDQTGKVKLLK